MTNKKAILHFELTENMGGIETFLLNLCKKLDKDKYDFDIITTSNKPAYKKDFDRLGCKIQQIPSKRNVFKYIRSLIYLIRNNRYDIVHFHKNSAANILPILIIRWVSGAKVIIHSHNTSPTKGKFSVLLHMLNRSFLYKISDEHLACSKVAGKWMFGDKQYDVIPNGIDITKFQFSEIERRNVREELSIPYDSIVFGNIGRFTKQKNHRLLIDIFEIIEKYREDAFLLLVGTGELQDEIKKIVEEKRISNVIFTGNRNDIPRIMSAMDLFIMTSFYEGFPIAAIEAQANSLPLFLSDRISQETDIIGNTSWFSLKQSPKSIALYAIDLIENKYKNRFLNNEKILRKLGYSMDATVEKIENYY